VAPIDSRHPDGRPTEEQPRWRQDFPIDTARDEYVSRRDFAKFLVLISGAMAAGQATLVGQSFVRKSREPGEPLPLVRSADLARGDVVRFHYPGPKDPCLLARLDDDRLLAYGQLCSHLLCPVIPDLESRRFLWHQLLRRPWWLASASYRRVLLQGVAHPGPTRHAA